jgi:LCP family protein required for cell wall assembly
MSTARREPSADNQPRSLLSKRLRWVGFGTLAALVVSLVFAGGALWRLNEQLDASGIDVYTTDGVPYQPPTQAEIRGPLNVLLIGSDTRINQDGNYGEHDGDLADVIILLHISEDRSNAVALSFPRDLMVSVPECPNPAGGDPSPAREFAQINSTLELGGPACTLLTVQELTGIDIPHLAVIDFKGVIGMTNVIGGVEVCVAQPINDPDSKLVLAEGYHTLQGEEALAFLRTRKSIGDGSDLSRISNQQVYLASLVRTLKAQNSFTNPVRLYQLASAAVENMKLSRGLTDLNVILQMAQQANRVDLDNITFLQLPVFDLDGEYTGRLGLQQERAQFLFDKLAADEPLILAAANPGSGVVVVDDPVKEPAPDSAPAAGEADTDGSATGEQPASAGQSSPDEGAKPATGPEPLPDWVRGTRGSTTSCTR